MRLIALLLIGIGLSGCVSSTGATYEPASEANFKPRDRELLSKVPYAKATIPACASHSTSCQSAPTWYMST